MAKSKRSGIILLASVFLAIYLIAEAGVYFVCRKNSESVTANYQTACTNTTDGLCELIGASLSSSVQSCNTIFYETWYNHLRNVIGYYSSEFDEANKYEIVKGITHTVSAAPYASNIIVIIPSDDIIIDQHGWYTLDRFKKIYGTVSVNVTDPESGRFDVESDSPFILIDDPNARRKPGRIALVINRSNLEKSLCSLLPENVCEYRLTLNNRVMFSTGSAPDKALHTEALCVYPDIRLEISFSPADTSGARLAFILISTELILLLLVVSLLTANRLLKPVHSLVLESGGSKTDLREPYSYVRAYISQLKDSQAQLLSESRDKEDTLVLLKERAREDLLYGILSERHFEFAESADEILFPWLRQGLDMCLLALAGSGKSPALKSADLLNSTFHIIEAETDDGVFALVWLKDDMSSAEKNEYRLMLRHEWSRLSGRLCFASHFFCTLSGLGDIASELKQEMREGVKISSALPSETRSLLSEQVLSGSSDEAEETVRHLMRCYEPSDVLNAVKNAAELPLSDGAARSWEDVLTEVSRIMESQQKELKESSQEGLKYIDWIDANYMNSELTVNSVAEYFGKHRTLISKEIKSVTGKAFSDYLREKRITEALKRMEAGNESIMQIAQEVGFVSYSTFKRAFIQFAGKSPMDYKSGKS